MRQSIFTPAYLRSFVFGVEDSLVATVGLVSGVAAAGATRSEILLAGIVLTFVEAFSMAAGDFLSESSAQDLEKSARSTLSSSIIAAVIMFVSYFVTGFIVIAPYVIFSTTIAFPFSITLALVALFLLGVASAQISKTSHMKKALTMVVVGGVAIFIGILAAGLLKRPFVSGL